MDNKVATKVVTLENFTKIPPCIHLELPYILQKKSIANIPGVHLPLPPEHGLRLAGRVQHRTHSCHHHPFGVTGVSFFDGNHGDPVRTGFRRQPEIDDFGKLLGHQRDKNLV